MSAKEAGSSHDEKKKHFQPASYHWPRAGHEAVTKDGHIAAWEGVQRGRLFGGKDGFRLRPNRRRRDQQEDPTNHRKTMKKRHHRVQIGKRLYIFLKISVVYANDMGPSSRWRWWRFRGPQVRTKAVKALLLNEVGNNGELVTRGASTKQTISFSSHKITCPFSFAFAWCSSCILSLAWL